MPKSFSPNQKRVRGALDEIARNRQLGWASLLRLDRLASKNLTDAVTDRSRELVTEDAGKLQTAELIGYRRGAACDCISVQGRH